MKKNFYNDKDLKNIFKKYIKIKKKFLVNSNKFVKNNFKGYKVLGVHFRGTDRITGSNHPMPPTLKQMFYLVDESLKRYKFDKIHLVTDDIRYFDAFKKRYKNKLTYRKESFRSKQSKIFHLKVRKNHRYEIGRDNIEEMLILSKLKFLICSASNLSQIAAMISKNNYKIMEINNEWNSKSLLIAQFKFYIKSFLPKYFFGFDKKPELKFIDFKDKI